MSRPSGGQRSGEEPRPPWPDVIVGAGKPFLGVPAPGDNIRDPKEVVSYGTVAGVPWSLAGFWANGGGSYSDSPGPCAELFLDADGEGGGTAVCAGRPSAGLPSTGPIYLGFVYSGAHPTFVGYFGLVPREVDRLRVSIPSGDALHLDTLTTTQELGLGYFVFFAPPESKGEASFADTSGNILEHGRFARCQ